MEFLTQHLGFPLEKLWATVYLDDEEAINIWKSLGMNPDHIVRLGKEDNFWEIGLGTMRTGLGDILRPRGRIRLR